MLDNKVWRRLLVLDASVVIERIDYDKDAEVVVAHVRRRRRTKQRCGRCAQRASGFDRGRGRRRWRGLDLGPLKVFVEADTPRVRCVDHGVVAAQVPWARHGAGHTGPSTTPWPGW